MNFFTATFYVKTAFVLALIARRHWQILRGVPAKIAALSLAGCTIGPGDSFESALTDPYHVWIADLKGYEGPVRHVGNDSTHAYFRIGRWPARYYKTPLGNVRTDGGTARVVNYRSVGPDKSLSTTKRRLPVKEAAR
jgi:hypothetical protein